jgi:metal-dependent amidase/aminoacylase/carboxypeptidase family protein
MYSWLPCQQSRTAAVVADHLEALGFRVQRNIGGQGVLGTLANGEGRAVLLHSDQVVLPVEEQTGLSCSRQVQQVDADGYTKRVMYAGGHDMRVASLLGRQLWCRESGNPGLARLSASSSQLKRNPSVPKP